MRHWKLKGTIGALAAVAVMCFASPALAQTIVGSKHDLSGESWNTTNQDLCTVCHTPHNGGRDNVTEAPLWDHSLTTQTFTPYATGNNTTMDANDVGQPAGISKICLSCHDGVTGLDSYGGVTGTNVMAANSTATFSTDLTQQHPISFTYDDTLATADGELHTPSDTNVTQLGNATIASAMLFAGELECASCHDVHNGTSETYFLRVGTANSDLCLACHDK